MSTTRSDSPATRHSPHLFLTLHVTINSSKIHNEAAKLAALTIKCSSSILSIFYSTQNKMSYNLLYANHNTLVNRPVGGWGGAVGSNTRGDLDKKGWAQAGNFVSVPFDGLYIHENKPLNYCYEDSYPLSLEEVQRITRCAPISATNAECPGQPCSSVCPCTGLPKCRCGKDSSCGGRVAGIM